MQMKLMLLYIQGNKRTPDKFVGREAIVTSQCLNGWYVHWYLQSFLNIHGK